MDSFKTRCMFFLKAKVLGSVKTSRDQLSVIDSDWLSSSLPMLLPSDGSVRILDASMKSANSPISEKDLSGKHAFLLAKCHGYRCLSKERYRNNQFYNPGFFLD